MKFKTGTRCPGRGLLFHSGTCLSVWVRRARALCALSFDRSGWKDERAAKRDPTTKKSDTAGNKIWLAQMERSWVGGSASTANETLTESEKQSQEPGKTTKPPVAESVWLSNFMFIFLILNLWDLPTQNFALMSIFLLTPDYVSKKPRDECTFSHGTLFIFERHSLTVWHFSTSNKRFHVIISWITGLPAFVCCLHGWWQPGSHTDALRLASLVSPRPLWIPADALKSVRSSCVWVWSVCTFFVFSLNYSFSFYGFFFFVFVFLMLAPSKTWQL